MLVTNVTLYKTPLDNSYDNVFDIEYFNTEVPDNPDYKAIYAQAIEQMYGTDKIEVTLPNYIKSLKLEDNKTVITLPYNQLDIRDYNYIKIDDKWFFITNTVSENDSVTETTPPSVTLYLEWDAWANNIDKIENKTLQGNIKQKHCNRYLDGDIVYYKNNNTEKLPTTKIKINEKNYRILYAKITIAKGVVLNKFNFTSLTTPQRGFTVDTNSGDMYYYNNRLVLYKPLYCLDENNNKLDFEIEHYMSNRYNNIDVTWELSTYFGYKNINYTFEGTDLDYIQDIELTFNTPLDISYKGIRGSTIIFGNNTLLTYVKFSDSNPLGLGLMLTPFSPKVGYQEEGAEREYVYPQIDPLLSLKTREYLNINYNDIFNTTYTDNVYSLYDFNDPKLNIYPYKYISLLINDTEIILSPERKYVTNFTIEKILDTPQLLIRIKDDIGYLSDKGIFVENSGTVSYSVTAEDRYLNRNGSSRKITLLSNYIKNSSGINTEIGSVIHNLYSDNISGLINNFTNISNRGFNIAETYLKDKALLRDLSNTPYITNNSNYAEDDIYYQDDVLLYKNECVDLQVILSTKKDLYLYGYDYDTNSNVLENSRFWFDYCKTNGVYIDLPMNTIDKKTIERIFNKGVFKYHINVTSNGLIVDRNLTKNGSLNNIERSIATI